MHLCPVDMVVLDDPGAAQLDEAGNSGRTGGSDCPALLRKKYLIIGHENRKNTLPSRLRHAGKSRHRLAPAGGAGEKKAGPSDDDCCGVDIDHVAESAGSARMKRAP